MKKSIASLCALLLALALVLPGCGSKDKDPAPDADPAPGTDQTQQDPAPADEDSSTKEIAATYQIDASPLGMPLQVYLIIQEDGTFQLTNRLEGGDEKGSGKVGRSGDTYMLLYSDSTADNPKTATFTVNGKQLVFSTKLFYGSSGFAPNTEDAQNPIYPVAKAMAYTDYLGDYAGVLEENVEAMGATLTYSCTLTLGYGAEYTFESLYSVMGSDQVFTQAGIFEIDGGKIVLTPSDGDASEGTISEDKTIDIQSLVSAQGSEKKDLTLKPATTSEQAGTYTGIKVMEMGPMSMAANATLTLDRLGGYTYLAQIEGEEDYTEEGSFTVDGTKLTFQSSAEGAEPVEGSLADHVLTCNFRISNDVAMATEITLYANDIQGEFTAAPADGEAEGCTSSLVLNADGTYTITVVKDGTETYSETGTFETASSAMGLSVLLVKEDGGIASGVVSDGAINVTHAIDAAGTEVGFQYKK